MKEQTKRPHEQASQPGATEEIEKSRWNTFLTEFTRENRGAHTRVEVLGSEVGHQVETEDRPFDGISADIKDTESTVWITFGSTPDDHIAHGIQNATAIRVRQPVGDSGPALEVVAQDGTTTLVQLSPPLAYAIPAGSARESR